jgi:hypothetical protein
MDILLSFNPGERGKICVAKLRNFFSRSEIGSKDFCRNASVTVKTATNIRKYADPSQGTQDIAWRSWMLSGIFLKVFEADC